jgi:PAS domain S-box-containing protein
VHQPDGVIVWCSPYTEVLTGYALSEIYAVRGDFLESHVHEDDRETFIKAQAIVTTAEPFQYRYRFYHKSGLSLWLETRTVPIFDPLAQEYVALSITLDVTASVNNQLKIEERNRDLNEFTYMISHDLKAPIVTLRGMLELVREECTRVSLEHAIEPLAYMQKAVVRLEQLVGGVLELARVSTTDRALEPVALQGVVCEVVEDFRLQIDQSDAVVNISDDLPRVLGASTQLYQIFSNLIGNALKYRNPDRAPVIAITSQNSPSRRRAFVSVRDNGKGIPEHYRDSIFKPFHRAGEEAVEGSGVGLACVKKLVEKLGGTITVKSVVGEGTEFVLEFRKASGDLSDS